MREMNIALVLIEQADSYVLQKRGSNPKIGAAGLIGCYGGKLEVGETSAQASARELAEETSVRITSTELDFLGKIEVTSDHELEQVKVFADCFALEIPVDQTFESLEGEAVLIPVAEVENWLGRMTPGTRKMFEQYILGGKT